MEYFQRTPRRTALQLHRLANLVLRVGERRYGRYAHAHERGVGVILQVNTQCKQL